MPYTGLFGLSRLLVLLLLPLAGLADPDVFPPVPTAAQARPFVAPNLLAKEMHALEYAATRTASTDADALQELGRQVEQGMRRLAVLDQTDDTGAIAYGRWLAPDMKTDARHLQSNRLALQQAGLAGLRHSVKLYKQYFRSKPELH